MAGQWIDWEARGRETAELYLDWLAWRLGYTSKNPPPKEKEKDDGSTIRRSPE